MSGPSHLRIPPPDVDEPTPAVEVTFTYFSREIRCRETDLVSMDELWDAAGRPHDSAPADWMQGEGADFAGHVERARGARGRREDSKGSGGDETLAHWQVGVAYGEALSPEFLMSVQEAFMQWAEEEGSPGCCSTGGSRP